MLKNQLLIIILKDKWWLRPGKEVGLTPVPKSSTTFFPRDSIYRIKSVHKLSWT